MDTKPRVARLVIFKHGVAYLERSGPAKGSFDLSFRVDEMNDVLKSLAVWVVDGDARLRSVNFDAPEDPDVALAQRGLLLGAGTALDTMLGSLRGRTIEVDDGALKRKGEVLGVQERTAAHGARRCLLLMRTEAGEVAVVDLDDVRKLRLLEEVSRDRLDFMVERSQAATAGDTRTVTVTLDGEARDLRVAYVIPAPVWRVSYRLLREGDKATLMALAIIHNPVDEDLENVELTLTTGQPVSFVIDLYHPKKIQRVVVEEETRAVAAPTRFERARGKAAPPAPAAAPAAMMMMEMAGPQGGNGAPAMADSFGASAEGAAAGVERGELFEYRVASPLSLRRGGSAMVPLAAKRVPAERERIWRDGAGPNPDLVMSFTNDTGLVLEEGPAVIYDEGVYAGESMLPYSARGVLVKMAFAKDLALRVTKQTQISTVIAGVRLERHGLLEEQRYELLSTVIAENDHDEEVELIVELPRVAGRTLSPDSPKPSEETVNFRRFSMTIAAHEKAEIKVREVWPQWRRVAFEALGGQDLERWMRDKLLDDATFKKLSGVLAHWQKARELDEQKARVEAEQAQAYAKQSKLSEQLNVLKESGPEGALRLRYVKELEAEQNKVNAAEAEARRLLEAALAERRAAQEELARLTSG